MGDDNFEDSESLLDSPRVTKTRKPSLDKTKPVQIIVRDPNDFHKFRLNEEALEAILTTDEKKSHQPICVLSVAGAFRKGKSFLINLFMNYLKNETLTDEIEMLFTWRGGATRDTTGILAWPELFTIKRNGQEMSLLILDTQGTFDEESTVRDNATIFALSCMTSSKIIYNISQQIQEDDLQHLELFTNYGELALESGQAKPFQTLTFLVRDWQVPYEFLYGRDKASEADPEYEITVSGNEYLRRKLIVKEGQHEDLANVREHVRDCFEKTECFLLPHPGLAVASNPKFHGQTKMIEKVFLEQTKSMFEKIYAEIQPKKVDGQVITSSQLLHFFKMYAKIFDEEDLPEPKSMLLATAEATLLSLHSDFSRQFDDEMKKKMAENGRAFSSSEFQQLSETQKGIVLTKFDTIKKLGTEELIGRFRNWQILRIIFSKTVG